MIEQPTPAPISELRLGLWLRRYERVKLTLLVIVLGLNLAIGGYLIGIARSNEDSLTILRCAVAKEVRTQPNGKPTTPEQASVAFDACVKRGGPTGP